MDHREENEMDVKISVIMPVYNQSEFLQDSLGAALAQDLDGIEIICINDGSTDDSLQILKIWQEKHPEIAIIDQENHGAGYSRNAGIRAARGEFIAFLDPDDYLISDHTYSLLYENAKKHHVQICGGSLWQDWHSKTEIRRSFEGYLKKQTFSEEGLIEYKDYQYDYGFYRFIYKRDLLIQNRIFFPDLIRFQDPPFFVKAMIAAEKFYAVPDCTYCYRLGHKPLKLTEDRICALIMGITENLKVSAENGLKELHLLSMTRIVTEYRHWILAGYDQRSVRVMDALAKAQQAVRTDWLEGSGMNCVYDGIFARDDELRQKNSEQENKIKDLKDQLSDQTSELFALHDQYDHMLYELGRERKISEELRNSTAFRIGSSVTLLPGTVKRMLKKGGNS